MDFKVGFWCMCECHGVLLWHKLDELQKDGERRKKILGLFFYRDSFVIFKRKLSVYV